MYEQLVSNLLQRIERGGLRLHYKGREKTFGDVADRLVGDIEVRDPAFFQRVVTDGELGLGTSYVAQEWTSPDLETLALVLNRNVGAFRSMLRGGNLLLSGLRFFEARAQRFLARRKGSNLENSKRGMSVAYDVGNDFFSHMLGANMLYSCAIFPSARVSLDEAQRHKMDVLIQKMGVERGHRVLEIGCGWGTLAGALEREQGCEVRGISLSQRQIEYCQQHHPGARFDYLDYRHLEDDGAYDRIVSVGMIEHVGFEYMEPFMGHVGRLLRPGGRAVLHTMVEGDLMDFGPGVHIRSFASGVVMPTSYIPSPSELARAVDATEGLWVVHSERFGPHYAETMRLWRRNVLDHSEELGQAYSPELVRTYDYLWAMSAACFASGNFDLQQMVVEKSPVGASGVVYDPRAVEPDTVDMRQIA